jgi:hypothetical protein
LAFTSASRLAFVFTSFENLSISPLLIVDRLHPQLKPTYQFRAEKALIRHCLEVGMCTRLRNGTVMSDS